MNPIWSGAPRYGPPAPLPSHAFLPGRTPRPPDAPPLPPEEAFLRGIDLYHAGFLWEAHEQWESVWRATEDPERRDFLQGLVQIAASVLKARTGNARGAAKLAQRAREHLARVKGERCMGLLLAALRAFDGDPPRLEVC
ncbi:MAG TPA: DUF309 domain-containing protein [Planctomycetota bacterium]|nr:DUF309 domain-containing protein [Planctomycetota bacterium]